ncbi:hypothetical protein VTH06DRAFT_193 [Thermothelomyces fergusii]
MRETLSIWTGNLSRSVVSHVWPPWVGGRRIKERHYLLVSKTEIKRKLGKNKNIMSIAEQTILQHSP